MLRLNLLRDLDASRSASTSAPRASQAPGPDAPKERSGGAGRRILAALAILILAGAGLFYLANRERIDDALDIGGKRTARLKQEAARADSLRALAVRAKASAAVDEALALSVAWLDQLETLPLADSARGKPSKRGAPAPSVSAVSSFTPPDRFLLKGAAKSVEWVSAIQEALVLLPGADLRESATEKTADGLQAYAFSGSLALEPGDSLPAVDRTRPATRLAEELDGLRAAALAAGVTLADPEQGPVTTGGGLEARSYRIAGICDSAGLGGVRSFLDAERRRGSPFGIRRLTLDQRDGHQTVILDIMAFSR
jgi:hypothetical protein